MNLNFNFYYSKNIKINGDVRYQIDTISLLKKNGFNINLGKKKIQWIKSSIIKNISLFVLRIPILSNILNSKLNYFSRSLSYDFINKNYTLFSHYFFLKPKNNNYVIWSTQGIMNKIYYKNYKNLSTIDSDIKLYKKIDKYKNVIFLIWDKKLAIRTRKICRIKSPIKVISPTLNYKEKILKKISYSVKKEVKLLFIGINPDIKGLKYLMKAIKSKELENYNFKLSIVTKSTLFQNSKKIFFYNNISEKFKHKLLKDCDIFILPTTAETFGYSILEAISYKCSIITTNFYPLNNFCKNNYNGYLVKNKSSKDIKKALLQLLKDKKKIELQKKRSFNIYKEKFGQEFFLGKIKKLSAEIKSGKVKSDI